MASADCQRMLGYNARNECRPAGEKLERVLELCLSIVMVMMQETWGSREDIKKSRTGWSQLPFERDLLHRKDPGALVLAPGVGRWASALSI